MSIISLRTLLILVLATWGLAAVPAQATVDCAEQEAPGGDWALSGNTPDNARNQPDETRLDAFSATFLEPAWQFRPRDHGVPGHFSNTPIVLDGCVYIATSVGYVAALNADTGELVWRSEQLEGNGVLTSANVITGSPTVVDDTLYVGVSRSGSPYVAALDRWTGNLLWTSVVEDAQPEAFTAAAPVHHDGLIFQGFSVYFSEDERGGFAVLDASRECSVESATTCTDPVEGATGGALKVHRYVIPDHDHHEGGYNGAGIWCTPAVDVETSYLYACTSNPYSPQEHRYTNSLLKVDLDESRPTFGEIVGAYKGNPDNYIDGLERQPACEHMPQSTPYFSATCVQLDLDFGASPHLFRDSLGRLIVGSLQKSGVYHAAYADNMQRAWTHVVGVPCLFFCNGSSPAHDGERAYVVGSPGATMWGLGLDSGHTRWATPIGNPFHYNPVSVANGVAYTVNGVGTLVGVDSETGRPVLQRSIAADTGWPIAEMNSSGVAIARSTVYAMAADWLVAYR